MELQVLSEKREKTEKLLNNIYTLSGIPDIMMKAVKMLENPYSSTNELTKLIEKDQGLATKLLSIANSPLYGLPRKVSTIDFAIMVIGYMDIKNIIVGLSLMESFKNKNDENLNSKDIWLHSFLCGSCCRRIAKDLELSLGGESFVSGLLHDMGIPIIHKYFHTSFLNILKDAKNSGASFMDAEIEHLGMTHSEIANHLLEKWNFPEELRNSVKFHHSVKGENAASKLTAILHLSDFLIYNYNPEKFYWDKDLTLDYSIVNTLNFKSEEDLNEFIIPYKAMIESEVSLIKF